MEMGSICVRMTWHTGLILRETQPTGPSTLPQGTGHVTTNKLVPRTSEIGNDLMSRLITYTENPNEADDDEKRNRMELMATGCGCGRTNSSDGPEETEPTCAGKPHKNNEKIRKTKKRLRK